MGAGGLVIFGISIAYIIWWFIALVTWFIPVVSIPIGGVGGLTLWHIIAVILFIFPCLLPILIYAFFGIIAGIAMLLD